MGVLECWQQGSKMECSWTKCLRSTGQKWKLNWLKVLAQSTSWCFVLQYSNLKSLVLFFHRSEKNFLTYILNITNSLVNDQGKHRFINSRALFACSLTKQFQLWRVKTKIDKRLTEFFAKLLMLLLLLFMFALTRLCLGFSSGSCSTLACPGIFYLWWTFPPRKYPSNKQTLIHR